MRNAEAELTVSPGLFEAAQTIAQRRRALLDRLRSTLEAQQFMQVCASLGWVIYLQGHQDPVTQRTETALDLARQLCGTEESDARTQKGHRVN